MTTTNDRRHEGLPADRQNVGRALLDVARNQMAERAQRIEHCVGQLSDDQLWWRPLEGMNSIANLLLHLGGNMTQWILSGVGGEPDHRYRPGEFADRSFAPKAEVLEGFKAVVARVDTLLAEFDETRLLEPRRIQGFEETVLSALWHCLEHLGGHTQEIICLTRMQLGDRYVFAWTPSSVEQGAGASV
jgi:hypothetical protein